MKPIEKYMTDRYGITELLRDFNAALLATPDVLEVEYDLNGFYDDMHQVIVLIKYVDSGGRGIQPSLSCEDWTTRRTSLVENVYELAKKYGLTRTEDRLEDYGTWFYMVFHSDDRWESTKRGQSI